MRTARICTVIGARPQFVKAAAVSRALSAFNASHADIHLDESLVHTGQHYDPAMSSVFFDELKIPAPAANLEVGSDTHARQTAAMLERLESHLTNAPADWVLIYGDTNSTLAAALTAAKLHIPIAHVEAGLRSFNRRMPEEINRIVADRLARLLFCPTATATANLAGEGIDRGVHLVGDVMYDSILFNARLASQQPDPTAKLGLKAKSYYLATVHRAENTDDPQRLGGILRAFERMARPIVLPLHPRTRKTLGAALKDLAANVRVIEPAAYLEMIALERSARLILTDSGGVQKEAYWLDVPCVTLRDETEWVELVEAGCNRLAGADAEAIAAAVEAFESAGCRLSPDRPADLYGDGHSAEKIAAILATEAANADR